MKSETQAVKKALLAKLDRLPVSKQTEVLDFENISLPGSVRRTLTPTSMLTLPPW